MVVLRCTQQLLVRLKQVDALPTIESTTRLGDWYGNTLQLGRRRVLIFISELSRLPVLIPIRDANRVPTVFPEAVCEMLEVVGIPAVDIAEERSRMSVIAFGRTRSRSLLGTLNDYSFMAGASALARHESFDGIARFLAKTPIMPLDGARPIELTRALFETPR